MAEHGKMEKTLGLLDVYAITTAGFFSAGFFVLPALAYDVGGGLAVLAYPLAALLMLPSMASLAELATALPRAGGPYFFLDRSLGPAVGTIGGIGTWLALVLKNCFAFIGLGAYLAVMPYLGDVIMPEDKDLAAWVIKGIAVVLTLGFAYLNIAGAKETTKLQNALVAFLGSVLLLFVAMGLIFGLSEGRPVIPPDIENYSTSEVSPISLKGTVSGLTSAIGLVFFTSIGIIKLVSVSEEIANPSRNIPWAIGLSILTATVINGLGIYIMIRTVNPSELSASYTPAIESATQFMAWGGLGLLLICIAAVAAFAGSGNAGILGASRYPLAMSRDHLIGPWFGRTNRAGMPISAILATAAVMILFILVLDAKAVAKLASSFVLIVFALFNLAVIVMRQSKLDSYDPTFRSWFYPWVQLAGILISIWLLADLGQESLLFSLGVTVVAGAWYVYYGSKHTERHGAIFHWFATLGKLQNDELDGEFRQIMVEKGARSADPFDDTVTRAQVIDAPPDAGFHSMLQKAAELLAKKLPRSAEFISEKFTESGSFGFSLLPHGAVLPHFRSPDLKEPALVLVRSREGIATREAGATDDDRVYAIFALVSPEDEPGIHLRILAHLAGTLEDGAFMQLWREAEDEQELKEVLMRDDRYLSLNVEAGTATAALVDQPLSATELPEGTLITMVRRTGRIFVPRGGTVLRDGDRVTVIGEPRGIMKLRQVYAAPSTEPAPGGPQAREADGQASAGAATPPPNIDGVRAGLQP